MENLNYKLIEAYKNNDLVNYLKYMDEYIKLGYGFDFEMILGYAKMLIKNRKYESAYKVLKSLEKIVDKYDIREELCDAYIYCFKPHDAHKLYIDRDKDFKDKSLLIKIYLLEGKVKKAYDALEQVLREGLPIYKRKEILECRSKIINHYQNGQFIETEYSCFIQNGNKLEPGYIVFLKNRPDSTISSHGDYKLDRRPYMIWKIENDNVYMFPLTTKGSKKDYIISKGKYHKYKDRTIMDRLCKTTLNNILTVRDKISDEDYENIIDKAFKSIYFGERSQLSESTYFMNSYVGEVKLHDIFESIDLNSRLSKYYFVIEIVNRGYKVVEVDTKKNRIIDYSKKTFRKNKGVFKIIKLSDDVKNSYLEQINEYEKREDLSWKKVISKNIKYIVLTEVDGICYSLNDAYSPSYIQCIEINKKDIDCIGEELTKEEILHIKKFLQESDKTNSFKKKIKELIY